MKKIMQHLLTLALVVLFLPTAHTQESNYVRQPGYWTFGINGGWAYQQSDVPTDWKGWGVGATLAKNLYYRPGAPLAFDLRGRFLYDRTFGLDHAQSSGIINNEALNGQRGDGIDYTAENGGPGFVYQNHHTEKGELALEGVLHFNRLREKTNIDLSIFGGIGLDLYKTKIDQRDFEGLYDTDYLALDPRDPVSLKKSFLRDNILDGDYETDAQGFGNGPKIGFMPELGVEIGYQLTPRFSMGLGHKVTFARNDLLDGQKWNNSNLSTGDNDIHHYTNLHMRWIIDPGSKLKPPVIEMIRPIGNPYTTRESYADIGANIRHVNSAMDVSCKVNGKSVSFNFQREHFSLFQDLRPGRNEVIITATNTAGQDRERLIILYEESIITPPPPNTRVRPRVTITNPPNRNVTTVNDIFDFTANLENVNNKREITLKVNGRSVSNFNYDASRGFLRANLRLEKGRNYVELSASNRGGSDDDDAIIEYDKRHQETDRRPEVRITKPSANPYRTDRRKVTIEAAVRNIRDKRDITLRFNGRSQRDFTFDGRVVCADVYLNPGENELEVEAENNAGRDRDSKILILNQRDDPPQTGRAPVVNFTRPSQSNTTSSASRYDVRASIKNVSSSRNIRFYLNGSRISNFSFRNETLTHSVNLRTGSNTLIIEASNAAGSDRDEVSIRYSRVVNTSKPPQVNITRPAGSSTSTANVNLEAKLRNVTRKSDITVTLNGRPVHNFNFNTASQVVTSSLVLNRGNNTIVVKAKNADGSDQDSKAITYTISSRPPQVTITRPVASTSTTPTVSLEAKVLNVTSKRDIRVTLNGKAISNFAFNTKNKIVSSSLTLARGRNTIVVKATNNDGSDQDSKAITYTTASKPPQVTITRPTASSTQSPIQEVLAKVLNVSSKSSITVTLNGSRVNDYSFNNSSKVMTAQVKLRQGNNTIVVKAQNADGSDQDSHSIAYIVKTNPPQVRITSPRNGAQLTSTSTTIKATINGVTSKSGVKFFVNNRPVTGFTLRGTAFNGIAKLSKGKNTIKITASNSDGSDQANITVYSDPPILMAKPVVKFTNPVKPGTRTTKSKFSVKVNVKNVKTKNQITFKVNGQKNTNFNFDARTGNLTSTVVLKNGNNSLEVVATNNTGTAKANSSVIFGGIIGSNTKAPTITFVSLSDPTIDPFDPNKGKSTFVAKTTSITSKSQITFLVNGKSSNNFTFNTRTKAIIANASLIKGSNVLILKVKNDAGADEVKRTLTF